MRSCDVIVIGGGITGLSAALHLRRAGIGNLLIASGSAEAAASRHGAGQLIGGQVDNFTRVSHAHGVEFGGRLWRFGDQAFDEVMTFCKNAAVPVAAGRRVRLITSSAELEEAEKACALLQEQGLAARLVKPTADLTPRVVAVQEEGDRAAYVDISRLVEALEQATQETPRLPRITRLEVSSSGVLAETEDQETIKAELVVVAAHLGTGALVPELNDALVPYADQWSEVKLERGVPAWRGTAFSANHTYEWGVFSAPDVVRFGGGRYLRPMAGIEATAAVSDVRIQGHLLEQLAKTFVFGDGATTSLTVASREIRPCDELPVIGPMYGNGRALIATGFMGMGLTLGFLAGRCLADLVKGGFSVTLPREIWPERLRTLEG